MHVIAITPPYFYPGEADAIAQALCERGFWRVHIRKPGASPERMRQLLEAVPAGLRPRLSVHDCFGLARELGIGGVHLNSRNPVAPDGWNGITSRSLHSVDEIAGMSDDYAFLSPVFPSISKPGYHSGIDIESLQPYLNDRIFALGGVTAEKLPLIEACGFGGAAMLGAAWGTRTDRDAFLLQFITHPTTRHGVVAGAQQAIDGGCRWVQLRNKDASPGTLTEEALAIAEICHNAGATFIIDDHVELVNISGADGVHLGKNDMPVDEAREILGPPKIIGATANTFADIEAAARQGADYIGLGPFRFTTTKKNLSPMLGPEGYREIMQRCRQAGINLPVVAIGGITQADIPTIMATGVNGIAASSSILSSADPSATTAALLASIRDSRNDRT